MREHVLWRKIVPDTRHTYKPVRGKHAGCIFSFKQLETISLAIKRLDPCHYRAYMHTASHKDGRLVEPRFKLAYARFSSCLVTRAPRKGPVIRLEAREHAHYV